MASTLQLLHLPTEILIRILEEVPSQASLASLARTCRQLQILVEPYLYRSVYLGNHAGESFTYAMDRKAVRAEYIQELVIHYHYVEDVPNEDEYYPILVESLVPTIGRLINLRQLVVKGLEYDICRSYDDPDFGPRPRLDALSEIWSWLFQQSSHAMAGVLPSLTTCLLPHAPLTLIPTLYIHRLTISRRANHERPYTHRKRNRRHVVLFLARDCPASPHATKPEHSSSHHLGPALRNTKLHQETLVQPNIPRNPEPALLRRITTVSPRDAPVPQSPQELHPKGIPLDDPMGILPHRPSRDRGRPQNPSTFTPEPRTRLLPTHKLPSPRLPGLQMPPTTHHRPEGPKR